MRRLIILLAVLAGLLIALAATGPYRARLSRETAEMQRRREEAARLRAAAASQAADRQRQEARVAADLAAHPQDPALQLRAGLEYLDLGDARQALQVLEPAARSRPDDAEVRAALGQAEEVSRRLDRALDEYRAARRLAPGEAAHDLRLAALLSRLAWRREALELLRGTVARSPRHAGARIALAMLQFQTGDLAAAEAQLRVARSLEPANAAVPGLLAEVYHTAGRLPEARQAAETALRLRPDDPDLLALSGSLAQEAGDAEGAERAARRALAIRPGHAQATETLARVLQARGQPAEALETLAPVLASPDASEAALLMAAQLARQLGQRSDAEAFMRRQARRQSWRREVARLGYRADLSPADPNLRLQLGRLYLSADDPARAVVELRRALELRPGWAPARRALTQARAANGE